MSSTEHDTRSEQQYRALVRQVAETCTMLAVAFVLAMTFRASVAAAYEIPSESMEPTIMTYDRVVAEKVSRHFRAPERGDIVVIDNPTGGSIPYIKRVVALQGQTVEIKGGAVWVDGVRLGEPYTHGVPSQPDSVTLPFTVPADHVWVMGDNRTHSKDSRYFGSVPVSTIQARALAVYWPPQHVSALSVNRRSEASATGAPVGSSR